MSSPRRPRRRRRRVLVLVLLLGALAVGALGGWATAALTGPRAVPVSTRPLPADNPDTPQTPLPDDPRPFLSTDLTYVADRIYSAGTVWSFERPADWERTVSKAGIRWVLPGSPEGTYSVRATPTSGSASTAETARGRLAALYESERAGGVADVELYALTDDTLEVTYVQLGRLRYQHSQFLPAGPGSSRAVFEVSASGRLGDRDGLDALAEHMISTITRS